MMQLKRDVPTIALWWAWRDRPSSYVDSAARRAFAHPAELVGGAAAAHVSLDGESVVAVEAHPVDRHVLHHPLHVVAGLRERDELDPVDRVDLRVARIAIALQPFLDAAAAGVVAGERSEEHTSELQSLRHLVCRLLLEKNKQ